MPRCLICLEDLQALLPIYPCISPYLHVSPYTSIHLPNRWPVCLEGL